MGYVSYHGTKKIYRLKISGVLSTNYHLSIDAARKSAYQFCKVGGPGTSCEVWEYQPNGKKKLSGKLIGSATRFFDSVGWVYHGKGKGLYNLYSSGSVRKAGR